MNKILQEPNWPFVSFWNKIFLFCLLSFAFIHFITRCHSPSPNVIFCFSLPFLVTHCRLLSLAVTRCHSLSLLVPLAVSRCSIRCQFLSLVVIRCLSLSFVVTRCTTLYHSFSLNVRLDCLLTNNHWSWNPNAFIPLLKKFTYNSSVWLPTFSCCFLEELNLSGRCYY